MGNKQNIDKQKINFSQEPIDLKKFPETIKKKNLTSSNDFSIEKMKEKALSIYEEAMKCNNEKEKYLKLKEAVSYDNTNSKILKEYFVSAKNYCDEYDSLINKYYYHINPEIYKDITGNDKTNSSIEQLSKVFNILKSYNIDNLEYHNEILEKNKILKFFYTDINELPLLNTNSTFSMKSNLELTLYEAYLSLFKEFYDCIKSMLTQLNKKNSDFDKNLIEFCLPEYEDRIKKIIEDTNADKITTIIYNSLFFTNTMQSINNYIVNVKETVEKCLKKDSNETEFYILLFIILEIKYMIIHQTPAVFTNKLKSFRQIDSNEELNKKTLKNVCKFDFKDSYKYDMKEIINEIKNGEAYKELNEIMLFKYIKLEYYNSNNIIRYMFNFIKKFNERISKSKTIIEALYKIYPELKQFKLFESNFTTELFQNALNNCYFFPFKEKVGATTLNSSGTILFFIPNKTKIKEKNLQTKLQIYFYLIGNLAVFIYIEFHEILGNFLRITLSKITEFNYISPRYPYSDSKEAGKCIEFLLFGKRISSFSVQELLFLLDVKNYDKKLKEFNEEFNNINLKPLAPSDELKNMLKEINIDFDLISINNEDNIASLFRDNYILNDIESEVEVPNLFNCVEYYEFSPDENLINLIKDCN